MLKLAENTLHDIASVAEIPRYDRRKLSAGIVHIGVGNFHRAHLAWYMHRLFQNGQNLDWAIIGAGVRPQDQEMRRKLLSQDYLTSLIQLDPNGVSGAITGSMINYLPVLDGHRVLIDQIADPRIRIVSMTITEGGYYYDFSANRFDTTHPEILLDAQVPDAPQTVLGVLVAALAQRRKTGARPLTGLCCDNLVSNGDVLKSCVVGMAELSDPDLAEWIASECSFPNSMVDCIVPATGPTEVARAHDIGIDDLAPVAHENFRQWVLEDKFCAGRPDWQDVGVSFSDDVHAYEKIKVRMLNGGHQILGDMGELLGINTISETMEHRQINAYFCKVQREEIAPHLQPVPDYAPIEYLDQLVTRFSNPMIRDTTRRVAFDGSSRQPGFILPSIRDGLARGAPIDGLALVSATWAKYCAGFRDNGEVIEANDPNWAGLRDRALAARDRPETWLAQASVFGDLAENSRFSKAFGRWLNMLWSKGAEATLSAYLSS